MQRYQRLLLTLVAIIVLLGAAAALGLHLATRALKEQVIQALGANSEVTDIVVDWSAIEVRGIRIRAPQGWPAEDALRADSVVVKPDLLGLLSARLHVPRIVVDNAYVSAWRTRDGKLRLLPSLLEKRTAPDAPSAVVPAFSIGTIELHHGTLEFFDSTVHQPPHMTRLEQLHARVDDLNLPALSGRTHLLIDGTVKGAQHTGRLSIEGWAELADGNSEIATKLQGVDLLALQPYLIKASETGVRRGTLDMKLKSTVRANRLHAPGTVTLSGLELAAGNGTFGTFMGVPRQAVVAALKNRKDQITISFALDSNLNDPQFSLNESFATRVGTAVAENLGISLEGIARGVGGATEGLGGMVKKLFGK